MLKQVRYIGIFDEVVVTRPGGVTQRVAQGETIDVPEDLADSLCDQTDNWEPVAASKTAKTEKG